MPSFSAKIKSELLCRPMGDGQTVAARLAGLTRTCGSLLLGGTPVLVYKTKLEPLAAYIADCASQFYKTEFMVERCQSGRSKVPLYRVTLSGDNIYTLLAECKFATRGADNDLHLTPLSKKVLTFPPTGQQAFFQGCFLGSGFCGDPKHGYRAEILFHSELLAKLAGDLLAKRGLRAALAKRREQTALYLDDADNVAGFLALIDVSFAVFELYENKAKKLGTNNENRLENCDAYNTDKALTAAARQVFAIQTIMRRTDLHSLPKVLREAAELRLENPLATIPELAALANIGKSGMSHRLSRLCALAEKSEF